MCARASWLSASNNQTRFQVLVATLTRASSHRARQQDEENATTITTQDIGNPWAACSLQRLLALDSRKHCHPYITTRRGFELRRLVLPRLTFKNIRTRDIALHIAGLVDSTADKTIAGGREGFQLLCRAAIVELQKL